MSCVPKKKKKYEMSAQLQFNLMHNWMISFRKKGCKCTKMPLVFTNQVFFVHEEGV